ncbi:MAG: alginate export family protein [Verrucomicrobiota bacterium]
MKNRKLIASIPFLAISGAVSLLAQDAPEPKESLLTQGFNKLEETVPGKFNINIRLRNEVFDLDTPSGNLPDGSPADRDGTAFRIRYGYTTPNFYGFTAMAEGETLTSVEGDIQPLDEAGEGTELNQLWIQYANPDYGKAKVGRQVYNLDDQRFIGSVGWRMNDQTFDGGTGDFTGIENLSAKAFYFGQQNTVTAEENDIDSFGFNFAYGFPEKATLTAFYYNIEGEDTGNAGSSNQTIGSRVVGGFSVSEQKFKYAASIAWQEAIDPSPLDYDGFYYAGDLSTNVFGVTLGAGFEILEPGFRTPYATVHKFNGFADALIPLNGFTDGLEDYYIYAGYKIPVGNGIMTKVIYHWFDPESKSAPGQNGGTEIDFVAAYKFAEYFSVVTKFGDYSTDGGVGTGGVGGNVGGLAGALDKTMFTIEINFIY